jgi:outer membrane protein
MLPFLLAARLPAAGHNSGDPARQSVPQAEPVLRLSLRQAVEIALGPEGNARVRLAEEFIRQSRARSSEARASLLPNIESSVTQQNRTVNLAAYGFPVDLSIPIPGFGFPTLVGPFTVFDARATASQTVFDLSSIKRFQAARSGVGLAETEKESVADQTRDQVARAYLGALRAQADRDAARADVELADALLRLASDQKAAGTGTGIEVTRAKVQLANDRQRLLVAENAIFRAHLGLLRVMGLDFDVTLELTDRLTFVPPEPLTPRQAFEISLESRADWKAEEKRLEAARLAASAIKMERVPSVSLFADYGSIGLGASNAIPTRTYGVFVKVPLFDGGRRDARRSESYSELRQEEIRAHDLRAQIELEVRLALDGLRSATEQVKAAEEGLSLAENELAQAERRYKAGMGSGIEVTDAQTRLERARENRIAALFNQNLSCLDLRSATGTIRRMIQ